MTEKDKTAHVELRDLLGIGILVVVLALVVAFGANIMSDIQGDFVTGTAGCNATHTTACGVDYNASGDGLTAIGKITAKLGLIVTVIIAAVIIGIVVKFFGGAGR